MRELVAGLALSAAAAAAGSPSPFPARPATAPARVTPSLSADALAAELRVGGQRRLEQLAEIQRERARLEQLAAEIALARRELARESALLEEKAAGLERARAAGAAGAGEKDANSSTTRGRDRAAVDDAQAATLARTVKGMKPDRAAAVMGRLEKPIAVAVLQKLRPRDAAAVLARMPSSNAAELFALMAHAGAPSR